MATTSSRPSYSNSCPAIQYINEVYRELEKMSVDSGFTLENMSARCFSIQYTDKDLKDFGHFVVSRRDSKGKFTVRVAVVRFDGTKEKTYRFIDIPSTTELARMIDNVVCNTRSTRCKAMDELDKFKAELSNGLEKLGYYVDAASGFNIGYKGSHMYIMLSISELGEFTAICRRTHCKASEQFTYKTGGVVSMENAKKLVTFINVIETNVLPKPKQN